MSRNCDKKFATTLALVHFELTYTLKNGTRNIRMVFMCDNGKRLWMETKEAINPRFWSKKYNRALSSAPLSHSLNRYLDELEGRLRDSVRKLRGQNKLVTPDSLRTEMRGETKSLWEYWEYFMDHPPPEVGERTLLIYSRAMRNMMAMSPNLSFGYIGQDTINDYIKFRRNAGINDSTIRTELNKFRALIRHAERSGVISEVPKLKIDIQGVDAGEIYLNQDEIAAIYALIGSDKLIGAQRDGHLEKSIRYFVLGTQLGVRVSDLKISKQNVVLHKGKKYLNLSNRKTDSAVIVPLSDLAIEILDSLDWTVPAVSDTRLNANIKVAGELAGIDQPIIWREKIKGKVRETVYKKYELISSHTMRRSFATNLYKAGAPSLMIMKITGHRTEASFLKYIRVTKQEAAEAIWHYLNDQAPELPGA